MKNYLQDNYLEIMGYNQLRIVVKDAWDKVRELEFWELINSIRDHCQAVINVMTTTKVE
jgi:hypothetical protein